MKRFGERLSQTEALFNLCRIAGRACEASGTLSLCIWRVRQSNACYGAYRLKIDSQFDERHFLAGLFVASGLDSLLEDRLNDQGEEPQKINDQLTRLRAAVEEVTELWRNNYRYASENRLFQDYLKRKVIPKRGNKGAKAQILRQKAKLLFQHARAIVEAGEKAWT